MNQALGTVSLVGAGPGDPELITLRAARRLAEADLVLYDALVDPRLLELAPRARRFYVGKRSGRPSMRQETIHGLLLRAARRGQKVVRLKGGDPFLLGRGGEEALALARAGIAVEYVPGVSSAIAAPGLAGIPVTHRGLSRGLLVLSAVPEETWRSVLPALSPLGLTVVLLMALGARRAIAARLLEAGWPAALPAAIVLAASTERQLVLDTRLADLGDAAIPSSHRDEAGLVVLGEAVSLRSGRLAQGKLWEGPDQAARGDLPVGEVEVRRDYGS